MESIGDLEGKDFGDTWRRKSLRLLLLRFTKVIFYKFKYLSNFVVMARKRQRNFSQEMLLPDVPEQQEEQMGGAAMPQPPQNWPQNEGQDIRSDSSTNEEQSKRPRGLTMMHSGWGKDGGILHVELNHLNQAIRPDAARLSSKLGVIARNGILAPLNHKDWRHVPKLYKNRIWAHIKVLKKLKKKVMY
uniref:Uncharacterized protein LOC104227240 isoform X2 n=1 Tax=Nicotiana sylvestris TaxID=4096 RepID=A0A1U7WCN4_NICSY|nr:PREDICTED: uncharacterized protein LOC104227240 isoform X2 [Nicotiana sylvestris]